MYYSFFLSFTDCIRAAMFKMHRVQSIYADSNSHDFVVVAALFRYAVIADAISSHATHWKLIWNALKKFPPGYKCVFACCYRVSCAELCLCSVDCIGSFTFITTLHCYEADLLVQLVWEKILVLYQVYMCVVETYSIIQQERTLQYRETLWIRLFLSMSIGLNEQQRLASTVFWCKDSPNVKVQLIDRPYFKP